MPDDHLSARAVQLLARPQHDEIWEYYQHTITARVKVLPESLTVQPHALFIREGCPQVWISFNSKGLARSLRLLSCCLPELGRHGVLINRDAAANLGGWSA